MPVQNDVYKRTNEDPRHQTLDANTADKSQSYSRVPSFSLGRPAPTQHDVWAMDPIDDPNPNPVSKKKNCHLDERLLEYFEIHLRDQSDVRLKGELLFSNCSFDWWKNLC